MATIHISKLTRRVCFSVNHPRKQYFWLKIIKDKFEVKLELNIEVQLVKYFDSKTIIELKLWARNRARFGTYKCKQNTACKFDILINQNGKYDLIIIAIVVI